MFSTSYCIASIIRVWIAYGEKKITQKQRSFFNFCHCWHALGMMLFSLTFANQPVDQLSLIIHSVPFMFLTFALLAGQIAVVMFGKLVAWKKVENETPIPSWFTTVAMVHVVLLGIVTVIKATLQVRMSIN